MHVSNSGVFLWCVGWHDWQGRPHTRVFDGMAEATDFMDRLENERGYRTECWELIDRELTEPDKP